ncbi:MAG: YunG family protein [Gaiellaceae bacterium]
MPIVDLKGREDEARALLTPFRDEWIVVGWEEDGELVACVGLEREQEDVAIRALSTRDDFGRALVDTVAGQANVRRLLSDVPLEGFDRDDAGRWYRELTDAPGTNVGATTLAELESAIRTAWSRETSDDPDEWSEDNRARGQCAVTSLLVRELLGGEILVANVLLDGRRLERHAWNRLPSGIAIDLTREQFRRGETFGEANVEEPLFTHRNPERFALLRSRVRDTLAL